jgi:hypothetical protein
VRIMACTSKENGTEASPSSLTRSIGPTTGVGQHPRIVQPHVAATANAVQECLALGPGASMRASALGLAAGFSWQAGCPAFGYSLKRALLAQPWHAEGRPSSHGVVRSGNSN